MYFDFVYIKYKCVFLCFDLQPKYVSIVLYRVFKLTVS